MRREQKQPKLQQTVSIPEDFREFMQHVHELIETEDESALMESDDLLQYERAYGGLMDEGSREYGFTYFPETNAVSNRRPKWELELDAVDIANICEGSKTTFKVWGCQSPDCECLFSNPEETCFYCDYVDEVT
ncbi:hypothetical protein [Gimesia algae]|uniref:Uncharacterized protein n=1 Tax=Gimesia algae TaxID=2527971 RepID=A0A517VBA1_9PLAN|nr:hypothetical protein [Gimesia algae]QDT90277.1 hypothetical protein Pan161_19270 [Gimesia algae]